MGPIARGIVAKSMFSDALLLKKWIFFGGVSDKNFANKSEGSCLALFTTVKVCSWLDFPEKMLCNME